MKENMNADISINKKNSNKMIQFMSKRNIKVNSIRYITAIAYI